MLISSLPYWVSVLLCSSILAFNIVAVLKAVAAIDLVSAVDDKVKAKIFFIKSLTTDAERLVSSARSETVKAECKKIYEAARYSDPMSDDALSDIENEIGVKFEKLAEAVVEDDAELVVEIVAALVIMLSDRNQRCKLLK